MGIRLKVGNGNEKTDVLKFKFDMKSVGVAEPDRYDQQVDTVLVTIGRIAADPCE